MILEPPRGRPVEGGGTNIKSGISGISPVNTKRKITYAFDNPDRHRNSFDIPVLYQVMRSKGIARF